jgi:hypothetical protein
MRYRLSSVLWTQAQVDTSPSSIGEQTFGPDHR